MTKRAAIILAGGRAERFQRAPEKWQDKALIELFGKPLLIHAVENVCETVEEIVVCVNNENRKAQYTSILSKNGISNVRVLVDEPCQVGGPIAGIFTGLLALKSDYCFTLPADMPFFNPKVIDFMFESAGNTRVVVPMWPNGRLETLTMVLNRTDALEVAKILCQLRRPRSDDIIRGALDVLLISIVREISNLDPELKSFVNINYQTDLIQLQPRQAQGQVSGSLQLCLGSLPRNELRCLQNASETFTEGKFLKASEHFSSCATHLEIENSFFWAGLSRENEGKSRLEYSKQQSNQQLNNEQASKAKKALLRAAKNYELEAKAHTDADAVFLAERAMSDKAWCESRANEH